MSNIFPLPQETASTIIAALANIGLQPVLNDNRALVYQLPYQSGLVLTVVFLCAYRRRWLLFERPALVMMVTEADGPSRIRREFLRRHLRLPRWEHEGRFIMELVANFTAATRAVADMERAGPCLL